MGEVYRARDNHLGRIVALKLLPVRLVDDREQLLRFQNEARTLASLNHPGIVTLHAVEQERDFHYLVMEYVEGTTLRDAIPGDGMGLKEFLETALALVDALAAAHEQGIVHRDLKPENVMFTRSGRLKVLDFGLARFEGPSPGAPTGAESPTSPLTQEGLILGTLPYLSPEQVEGRTADTRSDVFALGIIFFELLAGERPFHGESPVGLMTSILRDDPEALGDLRPDLPPGVEALVRRCLEKRPEDRYPSARDLLAGLQELRSGLEAARIISAASHASGIPAAARPLLPASLRGQAPLHGILLAVMGVNFLETTTEAWLRDTFGLGVDLGDKLAEAAHGIENQLSFDSHDITNAVAVHGFTLAYFVLFPVLALALAWALARREDGSYRCLVYAVGLVYALSLPFFLFFPVPERWYYPESGAVLLSDLWTSKFIEAFRPISGIDNCFPSFHTSLVAILVLVAYRAGLRHRHAVAFLGLVVVLSTFALGIHWLPDIAAGLSAGLLAFSLACRLAAKAGPAATTLQLDPPGQDAATERISSRSRAATGRTSGP
jgi:membrane-associated phospholipid phosphatase